jgi:hypothetical protein
VSFSVNLLHHFLVYLSFSLRVVEFFWLHMCMRVCVGVCVSVCACGYVCVCVFLFLCLRLSHPLAKKSKDIEQSKEKRLKRLFKYSLRRKLVES